MTIRYPPKRPTQPGGRELPLISFGVSHAASISALRPRARNRRLDAVRRAHEAARALCRYAGLRGATVEVARGTRQECAHFLVGRLREVLVPQPDRVERLGRDHAHDFVDLAA